MYSFGEKPQCAIVISNKNESEKSKEKKRYEMRELSNMRQRINSAFYVLFQLNIILSLCFPRALNFFFCFYQTFFFPDFPFVSSRKIENFLPILSHYNERSLFSILQTTFFHISLLFSSHIYIFFYVCGCKMIQMRK